MFKKHMSPPPIFSRGFTLAELLIVVSIVSVLVAVAIPVFSTQLEKAREATDLANMRDAKAAAVAMYLDDNENAGTYYWDAEKGTLVADKTGVNGYGKGTAKIGSSSNRFFDSTQEVYNAGVDCNGRIIKVIITDPEAANLNATIALSWDGATVVPSAPTEPSSSEEEPEEPPVVSTETITAGIYRFVDNPTAPSSSMTANIAFNFEGQDPSDTLTQIQVNATSLIYSDGSMGFYSAYNFSGTAWSTTYANIRTITISSDAEVSEEFYEWFTDNTEEEPEEPQLYAHHIIFSDTSFGANIGCRMTIVTQFQDSLSGVMNNSLDSEFILQLVSASTDQLDWYKGFDEPGPHSGPFSFDSDPTLTINKSYAEYNHFQITMSGTVSGVQKEASFDAMNIVSDTVTEID